MPQNNTDSFTPNADDNEGGNEYEEENETDHIRTTSTHHITHRKQVIKRLNIEE